jgi:hypothetical protein
VYSEEKKKKYWEPMRSGAVYEGWGEYSEFLVPQ